MSCFISELWVPEGSGSLPWQCCQHCRRRKDCPYACDQALYHAARQGHTTARILTAEADRLEEAISRADSIPSLLRASEALERTLSHALRSDAVGISF